MEEGHRKLKTKNILFLCSWYPCRANPFNGNFIQKHARSVVEDVNLHVLAVCQDKNLTKRFELEFGTEDSVPQLIVYYAPPKLRLLKYFFKLLAYFKGYVALSKQMGRIDLIHVHVLIDAGFFAGLVHIFRKTPYLITEHSTNFQKQNWTEIPKLSIPFIKWIAAKSSLILPVSKDLEKNMREFGLKSNYEVVPNVVNTKLFNLPKFRKKGNHIRFLHVSAFQDFKNVKGILRTVKVLSKKRVDFSMTITGDGDLPPHIEYAKELGINSNLLHFHGKMTEKEVADIMKKHDVFVLFSDYENLPCVLMEAQSCGMPIIATKVGGVSEIVTSEKLGTLISPQNEAALVHSMEYMIDNFRIFNRRLIREHTVQKFSEGRVRKRLIDVYRNVLSLANDE